MKRMMGIVSTVLLAGTMAFSGSNVLVHADTASKPYQVVTPGENNEKPVTVGFDTQKEFESYVKKHPVSPNLTKTFQLSSQIYSTFYYDTDLQGAKFTVNATRNPVVITNFSGTNNDAVSSILTHPFGNYTMIYEHNNAQGRALAIVNNGKYLNLTNISMGDGERTWNDQVSSATVKAN
ncbi:hypothetical protein CN553_23430 [Bacillus cereus]|uniref:Group-specific protein n=1 Tax=Bacillus cereus TaxID=1396 RepID=A0A9X6U8K3_BACCE|nr:hypothetical protein [Bacillus cereus]PEN88566.1 hypothetical protein CN553_23430 [Bacillus cereus]